MSSPSPTAGEFSNNSSEEKRRQIEDIRKIDAWTMDPKFTRTYVRLFALTMNIDF